MALATKSRTREVKNIISKIYGANRLCWKVMPVSIQSKLVINEGPVVSGVYRSDWSQVVGEVSQIQ